MVDITHKKCLEVDCNIIPNYNYEGEKQGLYCATHKKDNMTDIINRRCLEKDCTKQPVFNYNGEKIGLYCSIHKKNEMIDIQNKRCQEKDCTIVPHYNYEGGLNGLWCNKHKKERMINVIDRKCLEHDCNVRPNYNYEEEKQGLYCTTHKKENMIDVTHKICKTHLCYTIVQDKYKGYCLPCFIHLFPDEPNTRNYKTKEKATTDYILEKYPKFSWIVDKKIQDGCSGRRPDLLLDLGYQVIIIEVDENQHIGYDCSCENKRLMLLSQDVGHRPIIFIRFNPDEYLTKDNKITSCWGINRYGICIVKKTKQKEWIERLEALKLQIEYWLENKTDKTIEVIQLFYDTN